MSAELAQAEAIELKANPVTRESIVEIRLSGTALATHDAAKRLAATGVIRINGSVANRGGDGIRVYGVLLI